MPDAVTYTATLPLNRATVEHVAALLAAHRNAIGTRTGRRASWHGHVNDEDRSTDPQDTP